MKKVLHISVTAVVLVAAGVTLYNSINFADHSYFFKEENFNPYTNVNVFNGWANLLYVTTLSLLFTAVTFVVSSARAFFCGKYFDGFSLVLTTCCQAFVMLVYCAMQIAFKGDWGLYSKSPAAYHNLGGNLWVHVLTPLAVTVYFFLSLKGGNKEKVSLKKCCAVIFSALILYYIIAKIIGETCFSFRWFPYPIFTPEAIWFALFGGFNNYNPLVSHVLLALAIALIGFVIFAVIWLIVKIYNRFQKGN